MAVITTATIVVAGVLTVIGASGAAIHYATENDRRRAEIEQLQSDNENLAFARTTVETLKSRLELTKDYVELSKKDFKDGGHVQDDIPLANEEFNYSVGRIEAAINDTINLINDINATISNNNSEISTLRQEIAAANAAARQAGQDQMARRDGNPNTRPSGQTSRSGANNNSTNPRFNH